MGNEITLATTAGMRKLLSNDTIQNQVSAIIADPKKRDTLFSSMLSMVQQTPALQECEIQTVFNSAIAGSSLDLPYGFGYWYAVPYKNNKKGCKEAQFQIGAKGFKQLALRTGEYKEIEVSVIKEGELKYHNPITKKFEFEPIMDPVKREKAKTVGYYGWFELRNGYKKETYWPIEQMEAHADRYSQAFKLSIYNNIKLGKIKQQDMWKYSSEWYENFDTMAEKTIVKHLISKDGMVSVDMQRAVELDQSTVHITSDNTFTPNYIDNGNNGPVETPAPVEKQVDDEVKDGNSLMDQFNL